ncbi:MAG: histidine phosphatase family protein [Gammaproteobacteria bacterium]
MIRGKPGTVLFLVRHGESVWNAESRISGQLNPRLSATGIEQGLSLAKLLRDVALAHIHTSTLSRTVATAQVTAASQRVAIQRHAALQELNLGVLQGRFRDDRDPEARNMWQEWDRDKWRTRVRGGETLNDLARRVIPRLGQIVTTATGASLIVGHRQTNRVILGTLMRWPRARWDEIEPRARFLYAVTLGATPLVVTIRLTGRHKGKRYHGFRC